MKSNEEILADQELNIYSQMLDRLLAVFKPITDVFRQAYKNAGYPYGDNEEGFTRWLGELSDRVPDYRRRK